MKQGYIRGLGIAFIGCLLFNGESVMAKKTDALKEYKKKRDFSKTPEPAPHKKVKSGESLFVIQKHAASHLHYDFRLEIDGVLVSWAIPKGPSVDPADKRLAVMTEDHPLEYAHFEGVIPQGEYGGGTVMVWDSGTYTNIKQVKGKAVPMDECLKDGRIEIVLHGKKLHGAYALVRFKGEQKQWLCIKMKDAYAKPGSDITSSKPKSALTGRTMDQIARAGVVFDGDCSSTACSHKPKTVKKKKVVGKS
ncbi:MAG: DNA polymerase ligase N-terminal domain-containing protein, partial [Candidatus Babeliales bacterium]